MNEQQQNQEDAVVAKGQRPAGTSSLKFVLRLLALLVLVSPTAVLHDSLTA